MYNQNTEEDYEDDDGQSYIPPIPAHPDSPPAKKNRGKGKGAKENFVWKDDLVNYFINKWQEEPCLYNVKHAHYHDKMKRGLAIERIRENMSMMEFSPLPSKEQILDKMNGALNAPCLSLSIIHGLTKTLLFLLCFYGVI
jgi:hypothetical protein